MKIDLIIQPIKKQANQKAVNIKMALGVNCQGLKGAHIASGVLMVQKHVVLEYCCYE